VACGAPPTTLAETPVATPSAADVILSWFHELTVGENRFVVGLQDRDNNLILDAEVHLRFFRLADGEGTLEAEADTFPVTVQESFVHEHEDDSSHVHTGDEVGVYVAHVTFDEPGLWGVEVSAAVEGK
jgi:hypothetical protein